jgi:hypothetical protein
VVGGWLEMGVRVGGVNIGSLEVRVRSEMSQL